MRAIKMILKRFRIWVIAVTVLAIIAEALLSNSFYDLITFFLLLLLLLSVWVAGIKGKVSLWLALALLVFSVFLIILKRIIVAEKMANWSYFLFIIGASQMFWEELHYQSENNEHKKE